MRNLASPFLALAISAILRHANSMNNKHVFGYGSLVNRNTHDYNDMKQAQLPGWHRVWRHVEGRNVAFLTVERDDKSAIDGLTAQVPDTQWKALDERESSYVKESATSLSHHLPDGSDIHFYHAPRHLHIHSETLKPILLSYIDVVVQGFLSEFGEDGVARFFETTFGWEAPILNDRSAPIYPRHQNLSASETELVDHHLARLRVLIST